MYIHSWASVRECVHARMLRGENASRFIKVSVYVARRLQQCDALVLVGMVLSKMLRHDGRLGGVFTEGTVEVVVGQMPCAWLPISPITEVGDVRCCLKSVTGAQSNQCSPAGRR